MTPDALLDLATGAVLLAGFGTPGAFLLRHLWNNAPPPAPQPQPRRYAWASPVAVHKRKAVYVIGDGGAKVKIGISNDPDRRLKQLQSGCGTPLRVLYAIDHSNTDQGRKDRS